MPLLDELIEWLRIPSVSTGGGDPAALHEAAEWAARKVRAAGGSAELIVADGAPPLVVGELAAAREGAPTVLIYGHYDVQGPGPLDLWTSDPFEPDVRDGRVYARGAADDKGNFLPLLLTACDLAAAARLPVNVRVVVEGEEELGSDRVSKWIRADERGADCAIVFDSIMADEHTPALTVATRGMVGARLRVTTGRRDLHSGLYGGAALNAVHALAQALAAVIPGADGRVRPELRAGVEPPGEEEIASWNVLPPGEQALAEVGALPVSPEAGREFHLRTGSQPALDVHGLAAGSGSELRTIVPAVAEAAVSLRIVAGQRAQELAHTLERLLRDALPEGAELAIEWSLAEPAAFDPASPPLRLAREALARACGAEPALLRLGGTLPLLSALAERGIPAIVTGFVVPEDGYHAPDESFRLEAVELGERAAGELYAALAAL